MYQHTFSLKRQAYESPHVEVIEIETEGFVCDSVEDGTRGGIERMNMTNANWP